ncbi:MAG: ACP S-malonyltransferase [Candidatus Nitrospinota bacterium M3_3B_026]
MVDSMNPDTAFVFPGQGSQFVGMGASIIESRREAAARMEEAGDVLGFDIGRLIAEGPEDQLALTANTQPAILLVSYIALEALLGREPIEPVAAAGHSLGEFTACLAAGAIGFADALRLVRKRGELMQSAAPVGVGAMAAVIGLDADTVAAACAEAGGMAAPANFNSPEQTVIAGETAAVERAMEIAKEKGAKKAVRLQVSAPFHTSMMEPARAGLAEFMETIEFSDPRFPVIRNVDASASRTAEEVKDGLIRQVTGCVRWVDSVMEIKRMGVGRVLEVGPGRTLCGLIKRIDRSIETSPAGSMEDMDRIVEAYHGQA